MGILYPYSDHHRAFGKAQEQMLLDVNLFWVAVNGNCPLMESLKGSLAAMIFEEMLREQFWRQGVLLIFTQKLKWTERQRKRENTLGKSDKDVAPTYV